MDRVLAIVAHPIGWLLPLVAYVVGSIPFGLVLARVVAGQDVRAAGSGNIGATNVARVVGKKLGALTLVLDAAKGFVPVFIAVGAVDVVAADADRVVFAGVVGLCALVGHCFSLWLRLRGGKGVATGLGVLLALYPYAAAVGAVVFVAVYLAKHLASAASLLACCAVMVALLVHGPRDATLAPILLCFLIIVAKHHANIRRLLKREELRL